MKLDSYLPIYTKLKMDQWPQHENEGQWEENISSVTQDSGVGKGQDSIAQELRPPTDEWDHINQNASVEQSKQPIICERSSQSWRESLTDTNLNGEQSPG